MCAFSPQISCPSSFGFLTTPASVVVLSERIFEHVKMCEIRSEIYGASDHCPIVLEFAADEIA